MPIDSHVGPDVILERVDLILVESLGADQRVTRLGSDADQLVELEVQAAESLFFVFWIRKTIRNVNRWCRC